MYINIKENMMQWLQPIINLQQVSIYASIQEDSIDISFNFLMFVMS